jgi:F-type H+-transporting ATPase subunit delta
MRGTSEASRDAVLRAFEPVVNAAGSDGARLAEELFLVVDTLDSSGSLRRALSDPARAGSDKGALVASLFGKMDPRVRDVVTDFASRRWWHQNDLGDAIEEAAVNALLASAEAAGALEKVETELFSVERIIANESELHTALDLRSSLPSARTALAQAVFGPRLSPFTLTLVDRASSAPRGRRFAKIVATYVKVAAARRAQTVAHVTAATALSADQRERLAAALSRAYGREIRVNVTVDPSVIGGLKVRVADEVMDGSIIARVHDAQRRLAG